MSLATRCAACGTVFRVVQDQLRVSGGWVRCGRCSEVFNAVEHLVDLSLNAGVDPMPGAGAGAATLMPTPTPTPTVPHRGALPPTAAPSMAPVRRPAAADPDAPAATAGWSSPTVLDPVPADEIDREAPLDLDLTQAPAPAAVTTAPHGPVTAADVTAAETGVTAAEADVTAAEADVTADAGRAGSEVVRAAVAAERDPTLPTGERPTRDDVVQAAHVESGGAPEHDEPVPSKHGDDEAPMHPMASDAPADVAQPGFGPMGDAPRFVLDAERAARWRRPRVRAALGALALGAAALLALQVALVEHDALAARWPAWQPALGALCARAGCEVEPLRRIDALAVDSSGLVRSPDGGGVYRLAVVLRNRERVAVRVPAIELTLTDALGQAVARRVLDPAQLGARDDRVAPGAELALSALLRTADPAVTGYTIEIFYP